MNEEPVQQVANVTFRHAVHSNKIEALCHAQAEKLFKISNRLTRCEVVVDLPPAEQPDVSPGVTLHLTLPGDEIAVQESPGQVGLDAPATVRRVFASARRIVLEHAERRRDSKRQERG